MKFQPGQSGNPAGRPLGSLNKKTLAAQDAFEEKAQEIVDNVIERARNGDLSAERLVMERAVPTGRNRRFAIALPVIKTADDAEAALCGRDGRTGRWEAGGPRVLEPSCRDRPGAAGCRTDLENEAA